MSMLKRKVLIWNDGYRDGIGFAVCSTDLELGREKSKKVSRFDNTEYNRGYIDGLEEIMHKRHMDRIKL